jgi:hypothetical protein
MHVSLLAKRGSERLGRRRETWEKPDWLMVGRNHPKIAAIPSE